ncbi:MAG: NYN domain-containing protein [Chloroflexi bacterium]|nr:NYN domain-containing protein [Chloroflexota bacterium]
MPYLIDGHNLIPKIPGLSLQEADDEMRLVELLQDFCRRERKQVEVYFDNAPPGQMRARSYGQVIAYFVRAGGSADAAIRARLQRLGNEARNWTVVTSDRQVQAAARGARAQYVSAEGFAASLLRAAPAEQSRPDDAALSAGEVEEWLDLFGGE